MSRSRKKPIIKDNAFGNRLYRRVTKRSVRNSVRSSIDKLIEDEDDVIKDPKNIIDNYTRSDYKFDYRFDKEDTRWKEKSKRK